MRKKPIASYDAQDRLLRRPEVEAMTGLSRSSIYLQMSRGTFPRPIYVTAHAVRWPLSAVRSWVEERRARGPRV